MWQFKDFALKIRALTPEIPSERLKVCIDWDNTRCVIKSIRLCTFGGFHSVAEAYPWLNKIGTSWGRIVLLSVKSTNIEWLAHTIRARMLGWQPFSFPYSFAWTVDWNDGDVEAERGTKYSTLYWMMIFISHHWCVLQPRNQSSSNASGIIKFLFYHDMQIIWPDSRSPPIRLSDS